VTATAREQTSCKPLVDGVKKAVVGAQVIVLTTLPRGDLQVIQPAHVSDALLRAYARGFHAEDCLTWQTIIKRRPMRPGDCWGKEAFHGTPYYQEWMQPAGLAHVFAVPLAAPLLEGYPGALHVLRTADDGEFTDAEIQKVVELARQFDEKAANSRKGKKGSCYDGKCLERPAVRLSILDANQKPKFSNVEWKTLDERLREQLTDAARRRTHLLNGHGTSADRLQIPDSHGDAWVFRAVTYKRYPALGEGAFTFFCLQPDCYEWGVVKPADFNADAELSRLVPALKFMQQEFSRGPTLVEIAKQVGLSPFHFHRRFTELLGLTPKQFLLECQINKAKAELVSRQKELVQIAKDCGFAHQSHFTSRFKQATGLTPTRWRRMATERERERATV